MASSNNYSHKKKLLLAWLKILQVNQPFINACLWSGQSCQYNSWVLAPVFKYKCCFWCNLWFSFIWVHGRCPRLATNLVLQWCETDEAQEELSSWGHGHRGVHSCQAVCGPRQALPQAQDSFSWRGRDSLSTQLWFTRNTGALTLTGITECCWYEHTFVSLEEFKQSADCSYSRGHVWIFPHLRPEILHQLWPG